MIAIRSSKIDDLGEMQRLFADTIEAVCKNDYTPEKISAWKSSVENTSRWIKILATQHVLIAISNDIIVGFASLEGDSYLDLLYVHKDYQRKGVAYKLYREIETEAKRRGAIELISDVSVTARPFFEKQGFIAHNKNVNTIKGVELINCRMSKSLNSQL